MTLRAADLIGEPCTEAWDEMEGAGARRSCARCSKTVVDLSGMTEDEVLAHARPGTCVRVPIDEDGGIRLAMPIVPLSRLRARPAPALAAVAIAVTMACTPHVRPDAEPMPIAVVTPEVPTPSEPTILEVRREPARGHMMGAVMGTPRYKREPVFYRGADKGGVLCDTLDEHPLGSPAKLEEGHGLVPAKELAKADLLARCDP
jgi:hypothetical protein